MSPNTVKNMTYAAVGLCVMAFVYLVYNSIKKAKENEPTINANVDTQSTMEEDTVYQIKDESNTTDGISSISEAVSVEDDEENVGPETTDGDMVGGAAAPPRATTAPKRKGVAAPTATGVLEATVEDADEIAISDEPKKGNQAAATKAAAPKAKGGPQEYLVVAGAFSNKENAQVMLDKIKKMGYAKADFVKFNNSSYTSICVARYGNQAEAATLANALKGKGIAAYARLKRE